MLEAIEAGAEDMEADEELVEIFTAPSQLKVVKETLEALGYKFEDSGITMVPDNTVDIPPERAEQALRLLEALEDLDDVQEVYTNGDFEEGALEVS